MTHRQEVTIRRLHLRIAQHLIGVVKATLFQAASAAWFQPKKEDHG